MRKRKRTIKTKLRSPRSYTETWSSAEGRAFGQMEKSIKETCELEFSQPHRTKYGTSPGHLRLSHLVTMGLKGRRLRK